MSYAQIYLYTTKEMVGGDSLAVGVQYDCSPHITTRDKSVWFLFSPIFLSGNSFFLPIMLNVLLEVSIFCSKLSYIASYITVTSYTLYTSTTYTHHRQLYIAIYRLIMS